MTLTTKTTIQPFQESQVEKAKFTQAKEIALYSQETPGSVYNPLAHKYKGIVDANDPAKIFNVVGKDYKLLQHDEMYNVIDETIKNLGLKSKVKAEQTDEGARLRMTCYFPEISIKIGDRESGDPISLVMAFDNSYNYTTGLRGIVMGYSVAKNTSLIIGDAFAYKYHKHSKGLEVTQLAPMIEKGVNTFQTKVKEKWEKYYQTKVDPMKVKAFLEELRDEKFLAQKYLNKMIEGLMGGASVSGIGSVTNQWALYNLVADVMESEKSSIDVQENAVSKLDLTINNNIQKLGSA